MAYQPKSYRKFLAGSVSAALVATAVGPVVASAASFSDVNPNDSHAANIEKLVEKGYIKGYEDGTFKPYNNVTRGQVAKIFARILKDNGFQVPADKKAFDDVPVDAKDQELVEAAAIVKAAGVMTGNEGKLNPNQTMTRQQMAKVLVEAFDLTKPADFTSKITDLDKADEWARDYIKTLEANGVTVVTEYNPKGTVTRAAFASFVVRALDASSQTTAQDIQGVQYVDQNTLEVTFNGELKDVKKEDFAIEGVEIDSVSIKAAAAEEAKTTVVVIKTKTPLEEGKSYTISYKGQTTDKTKVDVPVVTPKVESVSANNLKTITVKFNKPVDSDSIKITNTTQGSAADALATDTVRVYKGTSQADLTYSLSADKKTLTLVVDNNSTFSQFSQSDSVKVVIDGLKTTDGKAFEKYETTTVLTDTTIPEAVSATATSSKTIELVFSEPINKNTANIYRTLDEVTVDGIKVNAQVSPADADNKLKLTLSSSLSAGSHTLVVKDFTDYAGLKISQKTFTINVAEDKTAPSITSATAVTKDKVRVTFNEPLSDIGTVTINGATFTNADEATAAPAFGTKKYVKVNDTTYDFYLPTTNFLTAAAIVEAKINYKSTADIENNKVDSVNGVDFTFTAENDTTAPTVTSSVVTASDATYNKNDVKLTFSKSIDPTTLNAASFVLKDANGNKLGAPAVYVVPNTDNKVVRLRWSGSDLATLNKGGVFTLEFNPSTSNTITDASVRVNKLANKVDSLTFADSTAPALGTVTLIQANTATKDAIIRVTFNEAMDEASLKNLGYYVWTHSGSSKTLDQVAGVTATVAADKKSVDITIPYTSISTPGTSLAAAGDTLTVLSVKDAAGNTLGTGFNTATPIAALTNMTAADVASVKATGKRTIELTLKSGHKFKTVDPNEFVLEAQASEVGNGNDVKVGDNANLQVVKADISEDGSKVVLTLSADLNKDGTFTGTFNNGTADNTGTNVPLTIAINPQGAGGTTNTVDLNGAPLVLAPVATNTTTTLNMPLDDKIAPELASTTPLKVQDTTTNSDKIIVTFDEPIAADVAGLDSYFDVRVNGVKLSTTGYDVLDGAAGGTSFTIKITEPGVKAANVTVSLLDGTPFADVAGNAAVTFTAKSPQTVAGTNDLVTERTAPDKAASGDAVYGVKTVKVKFSEKVLASNLDDISEWTLLKATGATAPAFGTAANGAGVRVVDLDANGYATTFEINLGSDGTDFVTGNTIKALQANVVDAAGNTAAADVTFTAKP